MQRIPLNYMRFNLNDFNLNDLLKLNSFRALKSRSENVNRGFFNLEKLTNASPF